MLAYLINPENKTITQVEHDESDASMHYLIQATQTRAVALGKDALYVPVNGSIPHYKFQMKGFLSPFYGRGLVSGRTVDGEMCDPRTNLAALRKMVSF